MRPRPNVLAGVLSFIWLIFIGVPIYAILIASFRESTSYLDGGPVVIPTDGFTLDNFVRVFSSPFPQYFVTTAIVVVGVVSLTLVLALPIAYAVVRGGTARSRNVLRLFLFGLAIPSQVVIIPMFWMVNAMKLYDTLWAIILPTAAFSLPVSVLILSTGMRDISKELYEAMMLDGASSVRSFVSLVLPLAKPAIATIAVFTGMAAWNGFLFPLVLTQSEKNKVVTLGLYHFIGEYGADYPALFAAVLLSAIPLLLVYIFGRRVLVRSLMGMGGK